jgi:HrpA-like RNA helicase
MLGAIDSEGNITALGEKMSFLPLEPCLSRTLLEAMEKYVHMHCLLYVYNEDIRFVNNDIMF